jgi:hypothetical protein
LICRIIGVLAPQAAVGRIIWSGLGAAFIVGGLTILRNRVELASGQLRVRGVIASESVVLDRLTSATAERQGGRNYSFWQLRLIDGEGGRVRLRLNGFPVAERLAVLDALRPYVVNPTVARDGPVENALAGDLWWPAATRGG